MFKILALLPERVMMVLLASAVMLSIGYIASLLFSERKQFWQILYDTSRIIDNRYFLYLKRNQDSIKTNLTNRIKEIHPFFPPLWFMVKNKIIKIELLLTSLVTSLSRQTSSYSEHRRADHRSHIITNKCLVIDFFFLFPKEEYNRG